MTGCATTPGDAEGADAAVADTPNSEALPSKAELAEAAAIDELVADLTAAGDKDLYAGRVEAAIVLYLEAARHKENADLWARLGYAYVQQKQWSPAAAAYHNLVKLAPDRPKAWEALGQIYLNQRQATEAASYFAKALNLDAELWRAHNGLGVAADLNGDHTVAAEHFEKAVALNETSPMLWTNYGYSQYLSNDFAAAKTSYETALRLNPDYKPAWSNLGLVTARMGNYDRALEWLSKTQEPAKAYNDVGYIAMLNGDWGVAEHLLRRATELSPTYYENAHENLKRLRVEKDKAAVARLDPQAAQSSERVVSSVAPRFNVPRYDPRMCERTRWPSACRICMMQPNPMECMARSLDGLLPLPEVGPPPGHKTGHKTGQKAP